MVEKIKLSATSANGARREAARRWPKNDVKLSGYDRNGDCVYLSLVRNVTSGNVATATKGIAAVTFYAIVLEPPLKLGNAMREISMDKD